MTNRILLLMVLLVLVAGEARTEPAPALATAPVRTAENNMAASADGVVEAVRQTVLAAQVAGAIVEIRVKAGDIVKAGQVLARIDARAADQSAHASQAQVQAARASLEVASKDFNRQKLLQQQGFISQAALDQAEAVYKASAAQVNAQIAQAGAARTQTDFFTLRAPYNGVVADVPVVQGDMAMPGRAIVTVYDPSELRVTASIPQSAEMTASSQAPQAPLSSQLPQSIRGARVELPGVTQNWIVPTRVTLLPTADPNTHTLQLRLDLPAGMTNVTPGMFARAWLQPATRSNGTDVPRLFVPAKAVVRRAEMSGVYVVDAQGRPALRQVRLGRAAEDSIEILSGISAGERVATDPQAAAKVR